MFGSIFIASDVTYQSNSRIASFANEYLEEFHQHFSIVSNSFRCGFYVKKNLPDSLSVQLPFESPVQLLLELKPNILVQNVQC